MTTPNSNDDGSLDVQILHNILINLVTNPEAVDIQRKIDEQGVLLSVVVDSKDMGIIIGRNGSMANSIKTIMRAVGKANNMNIRIQFLEPDGSVRYEGERKEKQGGDEHKEFTQEKREDTAQTPESISSQASSLDDDLKDFVIN